MHGISVTYYNDIVKLIKIIGIGGRLKDCELDSYMSKAGGYFLFESMKSTSYQLQLVWLENNPF